MVLLPLQSWGGELPVQFNSTLAIVFLVLFSLLMVLIGIVASRYQNDEEDYFVAGRGVGIVAVGLSVFAAQQSGWSLVGSPGVVYATGFDYFVLSLVFLPIGYLIAYWSIARKMRALGEVRNAITAPDAMYYRFPDERVRLLGAVSVLLGCIGYLAAQYAALGIIGSIILPVNFIQALIIGLVIVGFYTIVGGSLAAVWSDAIQGAMMVLGAGLTAYYVFTGYPGGLTGAVQTLQTEMPSFFNIALLGQNTPFAIGYTISIIVLALTVVGLPHVTTKFYMTRNVSMLKWGPIISGVALLSSYLFLLLGPIMRSAVMTGQFSGEIPTPDAVMPLALISYAPEVVVSFVLVAVIAAIMSTSNAFLNVGASAIVHDYLLEYRDYELSQEDQVKYARATTAALLVFSFGLAASFPGLIFFLGAIGWALFGTVLVPCIAVAYNWKGATLEGALVGGGGGLIAAIIIALLSNYLGIAVPFDFLGAQVAQIFGFVLFIVVSLFTSTYEYDDLEDDIKEIMTLGRLRGGEPSPTGVAADGGRQEEE